MIAGCYTLHLYCDFGDNGIHGGVEAYKLNFPGQFSGKTERDCFREARKKGWRIYKEDRQAKCPHCVQEERRHERASASPYDVSGNPTKDYPGE